MQEISMRRMRVDQKGIVTAVKAEGQLGRRIRDLGLIAGTEIRIVGRAPLYDPVALRLNGYTLTLRNREADYIFCNTEE